MIPSTSFRFPEYKANPYKQEFPIYRVSSVRKQTQVAGLVYTSLLRSVFGLRTTSLVILLMTV